MSKGYQLPANHVAAINADLANLHQAEQHMAKAEQCGLDCTQQRAQVSEIRNRLNLIRQHFGVPIAS